MFVLIRLLIANVPDCDVRMAVMKRVRVSADCDSMWNCCRVEFEFECCRL